MPGLAHSSGYRYLQETKFTRADIRQHTRADINPTEPFKRYPEAKKIPLPRNWQPVEPDLVNLLQYRRSHRKYTSEPISSTDLAFLLWTAQGGTAKSDSHLLRTAPSAGALYPIETYVSVQNVIGIAPGLTHFDPANFQLDRLSGEHAGRAVSEAALGQNFLANAAAVFIWSTVFRRNMAKYGGRGMRYILMDVGHICQNLLLGAEALGLGACPVAAFFDDELNALLGLDGEEESVVYLAGVGKR